MKLNKNTVGILIMYGEFLTSLIDEKNGDNKEPIEQNKNRFTE